MLMRMALSLNGGSLEIIKMTQETMFATVNQRAFNVNEVMLDLLFGSNPITDDELRSLITKRPEAYARFANYLGKR